MISKWSKNKEKQLQKIVAYHNKNYKKKFILVLQLKHSFPNLNFFRKFWIEIKQ